MTEIKLRAWDKETNTMFDVVKIDFRYEAPYWVGYFGNPHWGARNPKTDRLELIPFIGITDKNGKDIYERDILYCSSWWWGTGFVYLNKGECGPCSGDSVSSYIMAKDIDNPKKGASHNSWNGAEVEVIGNIYETPELIGKHKRTPTPIICGGEKNHD